MQVVRKVLVYILTLIWGHVGRNHQVNVRHEEEGGHREGRANSGTPVGELDALIEIDVDEAQGDENIDNRQRVRDQAKSYTETVRTRGLYPRSEDERKLT